MPCVPCPPKTGSFCVVVFYTGSADDVRTKIVEWRGYWNETRPYDGIGQKVPILPHLACCVPSLPQVIEEVCTGHPSPYQHNCGQILEAGAGNLSVMSTTAAEDVQSQRQSHLMPGLACELLSQACRWTNAWCRNPHRYSMKMLSRHRRSRSSKSVC